MIQPLIFAQSQWWWALVIVGIFVVIVGIVIFIKRHVKAFKTDERPKSEKEIAAEEVNRLLETVEEDKKEEE